MANHGEMADEAVSPVPASGGGETTSAEGEEVVGAEESSSLDFVLDVPLRVTVEIGSARLLVRDVLQLNKGSVVELDRTSGEPADLFVNDRLVARGEITVVDDRMALRVVEVVGADRPGRSRR